MTALDVATIKRDFPILEREVNGKRLAYLDSASSAQKPNAVLDAMDDCYRRYYANIHRGVYSIAEEATAAYEQARRKVARFVERAVGVGDRVRAQRDRSHQPRRVHLGPRQPARGRRRSCSRHMEHHANVVPWHMLAAERGVELRWIPLTDDFRLDLSDLDRLLDGARLLAVIGNVERARHDQRHPAARRRRARPRRAGPRRRVPVRAARRHRRAGVGRRLRRVLRAQDVRSERDRRAVGARRAARGDAAVPRRRRDDPRRPARRLHDERRALEVRGGNACRSPRRSASAPRSTT